MTEITEEDCIESDLGWLTDERKLCVLLLSNHPMKAGRLERLFILFVCVFDRWYDFHGFRILPDDITATDEVEETINLGEGIGFIKFNKGMFMLTEYGEKLAKAIETEKFKMYSDVCMLQTCVYNMPDNVLALLLYDQFGKYYPHTESQVKKLYKKYHFPLCKAHTKSLFYMGIQIPYTYGDYDVWKKN